MKTYLQKAFQTFKENSNLYLQVSLVLGMILAFSTFIGMITGTFIIFIFVLLPLVVSVFAIAMKTGLGKETSNRDIYFGYKNFGTSLVLTTKILMKPILMSFLTYLIIGLVGYGILFYMLQASGDPIMDIIASGDAMAATEAIVELIQTDTKFLIVTYLGLGVAFIVGFNIFLKRSLAPLICFETTFTLDSAKKMSMNMTKKENKFFLFNNIFVIMYVILLIISELFQMIIYTAELNFYVLYFIDLLVIFLLMAPLLFLNALFIFHYYDDKHRERVNKLYKDYLNVAMRTTQDNMINNEFKNKDDNDIIDNENKQNK